MASTLMWPFNNVKQIIRAKSCIFALCSLKPRCFQKTAGKNFIGVDWF